MNCIYPIAPIVLFVYNRPEHTKKTLQALSNNKLANESILYIYCDGVPSNASSSLIENNNLVKKVIREKQWCKEVNVIEAKKNKGLAASVISGINDTINKHGKVIVLEDDLITTTTFLEYMNISLEKYKNNNNVFQISGYGFPTTRVKKENSSFFLNVTSTWGWATWKRAWDLIDFECKDYELLKKDKNLVHEFNFQGAYDYKKMFLKQMESSEISSWGIRFYWNVFKNKALVLYPDKSLVRNIGWDNSGKHKDNYEIFPIKNWDFNYQIYNFPKKIVVDLKNQDIIKKYIKKRTSLKIKAFGYFANFLKLK